MIRAVVVDDEPLVRQGLRMVLEHGGDVQVVDEGDDGAAAVRLASTADVDVVLLDIRMPVMDGIEAARRITASPQHPTVVMLTTFSDDALLVGAMRAGASGYLLKSMPPAEIRAAVRSAVEGRTSLAPSLVDRLVQEYASRPVSPAPELSRLTERELDVLRLLARGSANKQIGVSLKISESTVKTHVANIFQKLNVSDRTEAVTVALQRGLIKL